MAEVTAALCAVHLCPPHEQAAVGRRVNGMLERGAKAGPAGAALEFHIRRKELLAACRAGEGTAALFLVQRARPSTLRAVLAEHVELLRRQALAPLVFGLLCHRFVL